ncbi:methyltransferase domain-containing protein [Phanerochaete sordida]|uniref:Methyltransferase domain-containing protein n=1 Tax=Phanerochaete sordida TaxID=48140 RepID=A0A9P3GJ64_9APHY|nr:methyltransferase domain-containing protein [Phanerochaete sordida]
MHLRAALAPLGDMQACLRVALWPTIKAILRRPTLLLHPSLISKEFMSHVWVMYGAGIDKDTREIKSSLMTPNAYGVVLDVGAGHGHSAQYLDHSKVTKYVALEPNSNMHPEIRRIAGEAGFKEDDGTLLIVPYGAEDIALLVSALGGPHTVNTIVSILSLCGVPDPKATMRALTNQVLAPGGEVLFYEHVLSRRADVAWWQRAWTPIWKRAFDGCCLDRPTDIWLEELDCWQSKEVWGKEGEPEEHLWWHRSGKLIKAA